MTQEADTGADGTDELVHPSPRIPVGVFEDFRAYVEERSPTGNVSEAASRAVERHIHPTEQDEQLQDLWRAAARLFDDSAHDPVNGRPLDMDEDISFNKQLEVTASNHWARMDDSEFRSMDKTQIKMSIPRQTKNDLIERAGGEYHMGREVTQALVQWMERERYLSEALEMLEPQAEIVEDVSEDTGESLPENPLDPETISPEALPRGADECASILLRVLLHELREREKRVWSKSDIYRVSHRVFHRDGDGRTKQTSRNYARAAMERMPSTEGFVDRLDEVREENVEEKIERDNLQSPDEYRRENNKASKYWGVSDSMLASVVDEPRFAFGEYDLAMWLGTVVLPRVDDYLYGPAFDAVRVRLLEGLDNDVLDREVAFDGEEDTLENHLLSL